MTIIKYFNILKINVKILFKFIENNYFILLNIHRRKFPSDYESLFPPINLYNLHI